jgi:hypothetical protein
MKSNLCTTGHLVVSEELNLRRFTGWIWGHESINRFSADNRK